MRLKHPFVSNPFSTVSLLLWYKPPHRGGLRDPFKVTWYDLDYGYISGVGSWGPEVGLNGKTSVVKSEGDVYA